MRRRAGSPDRRAIEYQQPQSIGMCAEVLVEPVASHGRRADHAHRLIGLPFHLVAMPGVPGLHPEPVGPSEAVAFAFDADEDRAGGMLVCL